MSRNTWPGEAYRATFPVDPADTGAGPVRVEQGGAYLPVDGSPVAHARRDLDLVLVLLATDDDAAREAVVDTVRVAEPSAQVVVYRARTPRQRHAQVVTAHGPAGSREAMGAAARRVTSGGDVVLSGRELLTLGAQDGQPVSSR